MKADHASRQRGAAIFALATAAATIVTLSAVLKLEGALHVKPAVPLDFLRDGGFRSEWMEGTLSAASQQASAAAQWLHLITVFAAVAAVVGLINGLMGLLAHANERRYETAVRGLVGASPRALTLLHARNALTNTMLGAGAGVPLGIICAVALRRAGRMGVGIGVANWTIIALIASLLVTLFAANAARARSHRRGWLGDALAPEARSLPGFGADDLRTVLNVAQLSCAVALSIAGGLVWSYARAQAALPPARSANVQVAEVSLHANDVAQRRRMIQQILQRAGSQPGVTAESIASPGALLGLGRIDKVIAHCGDCARANAAAPMFPVETQQHVVGGHFFAAAGIPVVLGREFNGDSSDAGGIIINRSFAQQAFDDPEPLGKEITVNGFFGKSYRVIGIVADVPTIGLHTLEPDPGALTAHTPVPNAPAVYFSAFEQPPAEFDLIVNSAGPQLAGISFVPLASFYAAATAPQRWFSLVLLTLAVLLYLAAMVGAAITAMLSVQSRRVEIAVRRAVGARKRDIWALVFGLAAGLAGRSLVIGVVLSLAVTRVLEVFVPGLPAISWQITAVVAGVFLVLMAAATMWPARAAAKLTLIRD